MAVLMGRFGVADLRSLTDRWDCAVEATPGLDPYCGSSDWSFSAAESFSIAEPPVITTSGDSFCGMRRLVQEDGTVVLVGLDPIWGFASPVVGPSLDALAALRARLKLEKWDVALVTGQHETMALTQRLARGLDNYRLLRGPIQERLRADLSNGIEPWWDQRSSRFRQQLRRIEARADDEGLEVVDASADLVDTIMDRILAIESLSWKAEEGTGLNAPDLADFYRRITRRLAVEGRLRFLVATRDGVDLGYVLGGVRGRTYRGMQLSYVRAAAEYSVGHLLQLHQIRRLDAEIDTYDLGMAMDYKTRWADRSDDTIGMLIIR
jgi:CelD/BcsL family acetyltransferase involved in cellulose biosynthesis